jgi:carbonic anhydrase
MILRVSKFCLCGLVLLLPLSGMADDTAPAWSYGAGANNDEGWGELSPGYAVCEIGTSQSPVVIAYTTIADVPPLSFHYGKSTAHMHKKEGTLVITIDGDNTLTIGEQTYHLMEIRFHTPSEHSVQGKNYLLETHFIHKDDKGKILIVAVFANYGESNAAIQVILDGIKTNPAAELAFDPNLLMPERKGYYAYSGSLSWPPCTEGVEWRVLKTPVSVSKEQFKVLASLLQRNARLPQPLYLRTITESTD